MKRLLAGLLCLVLVTPPLSAGPKGGGSSFKPSSNGSSFKGGSTRPTTTPPTTTTKPGSSFQGGSAHTTPPKTTAPTNAPRSSWAGGSTSVTKTTTTKPPPPKFDNLARTEARKAESRISYQKAMEPAPSYKTGSGKSIKLNANDTAVKKVRSMSQETWVNRETRVTNVYRTYTSYPPLYYDDPFHPHLNYWLLDHGLATTALFIYHQQGIINEARVASLYAQNSGLRAQVLALEQQRLPRDRSYVPPNMDYDALFDDDFVDSAVNPQLITTSPVVRRVPSIGDFWYGLWVVIKWSFNIVVAVALVALVVWLLFYKRW